MRQGKKSLCLLNPIHIKIGIFIFDQKVQGCDAKVGRSFSEMDSISYCIIIIIIIVGVMNTGTMLGAVMDPWHLRQKQSHKYRRSHDEHSADFHHFIIHPLLLTWPHSLVIEQEMSLIVESCPRPSNWLCTDRHLAIIDPILITGQWPAVLQIHSRQSENHLFISDLWHLRESSEEMSVLNDSITMLQCAPALGAKVSLKPELFGIIMMSLGFSKPKHFWNSAYV